LLAAPTVQRSAGAQDSPEVTPQKWEKGKGWGWVWGDDDELGNLNELGPDLTKKALSLVKEGRVYDLGLTYKRSSYKFAGHNPGEIISFRTPTGMLNQKDLDFVRSEEDNSLNTTFTSNALFISDNVATQIDALGHIFEGDPPHAYNGHRYEDIQSDWGLLKMGAETIPPIVAPATMIDVAKSAGEDPLPESYAIGPDRLQKALDEQGVDIDPLDVVLVRTGTAGVWMEGNGVGANEEEMAKVDTAGLTVSGPSGSSKRRERWPSARTPRASRCSRPRSSSTTGRASTRFTCTCSCARASTPSSTTTRKRSPRTRSTSSRTCWG
jgi:hypothetical protein